MPGTRFAYTTCPKCGHIVVLVDDDDVKDTWQFICAGNGMYGYGFCGTAFEIRDRDGEVE